MWHYRRTDGQNIYRIDAHLWGESSTKKIGAISQLGAEKITFSPKPGRHTYRRTDICFYRVALLLKKNFLFTDSYLQTNWPTWITKKFPWRQISLLSIYFKFKMYNVDTSRKSKYIPQQFNSTWSYRMLYKLMMIRMRA